MHKDNSVFILTKVFNTAQHYFAFGKAIVKPCAIIPNDKEFDPLSVEPDVFDKKILDVLDATIDCLQASDAVGALRDKGISAFAIAELKLFFTTVFLKNFQAEHTLDEMRRVNEMLDAFIHELVRRERKEKMPELKATPSTFHFIMEKVNRLSAMERRKFLNAKQGQPLPDFVQKWQNEMPYNVSDKTFSNCLSRVRKEFRKENKRSKRRK